MKTLLKPIAMLLAIFTAMASPGEVIDRIVAIVNRTPILQSDWDCAVNFEAFVDGKAVNSVTAEDRQATLKRLIDQTLIEQTMHASDFVATSDLEISTRVAEI